MSGAGVRRPGFSQDGRLVLGCVRGLGRSSGAWPTPPQRREVSPGVEQNAHCRCPSSLGDSPSVWKPGSRLSQVPPEEGGTDRVSDTGPFLEPGAWPSSPACPRFQQAGRGSVGLGSGRDGSPLQCHLERTHASAGAGTFGSQREPWRSPHRQGDKAGEGRKTVQRKVRMSGWAEGTAPCR